MAATSIAGITSGGGTFIPSLDNLFGLTIGDEYEYDYNSGTSEVGDHDHGSTTSFETSGGRVVWSNPHLKSAITPYIPNEDNELIGSCNQTFNVAIQKLALTQEELNEQFFLHDCSVFIFSQLDLPSLICCTKVSKCFHVITKRSLIWENQLVNLLPKVKPLSSQICIFSPQNQFQIIYKKIRDHQKPFIAKFEHTLEQCRAWKQELIQLEQEYEAIGGKNAHEIAKDKFQAIAIERNLENNFQGLIKLGQEDEFNPMRLKKKIAGLDYNLNSFTGGTFDGSYESITDESLLGRILDVIHHKIIATFDDQDKFEETIRQSEVLKNTTSSNDGPIIEDVTHAE